MTRPFYTTFAWAYDHLVSGAVSERVAFIVQQLAARGVHPAAQLLDAGCGTGAYAIALAQRGFNVTGIDESADLLAAAQGKAARARLAVRYVVGDILYLPTNVRFDALLCRGVLNDLTDSDARKRVFHSFAGAMRCGGCLILDVREWHATAERKRLHSAFEKAVETERGLLTFRSVTELLPDRQCLLVSEAHVLEAPGGRQTAHYDFVMRCWTADELAESLTAAGFESVQFFGDYDASQPIGSTDRVVAVAVLGERQK